MNQKERMLDGKIYDPADDELAALRKTAHHLCRLYNTLDETDEKREELLSELVPSKGDNVYLQGPVQFDYGVFTSIGDNTYANFNFTCLDCAPVSIGSNVFFGPNVSILTPVHPLLAKDRNIYTRGDGVMTDREYAKPITIEDDVWIAGNVTVCGGVTVGKGSVIGAGSVVTRNIPPHSLAFGNPCRVVRTLDESDSLASHPEIAL